MIGINQQSMKPPFANIMQSYLHYLQINDAGHTDRGVSVNDL